MRFLIAGSSGFLGTSLRHRLHHLGHPVTRLVRHAPRSAEESQWDPYAGTLDRDQVERADVVVNLAGSPLAGNPHSSRYRRTLLESRVQGTRVLAEAIAGSERRPAYLAQNGTSWYGDRGDELLTEDSGPGEGSLLTPVTRQWQEATTPASDAGARVCVLRTAPALGGSGGAFPLMRRGFATGLAGPLGNGKQWFPIISIEDWVRAVLHLTERTEVSGPVNLVAPEPTTNGEFTRELGKRLRRPTALRIPAPLIRAAAGPMAPELLGSFRILPQRLLDSGFEFHHPDVGAVLDAALARS